MNLLRIFLILPFLFAFKFNPMSQSIDLAENQRAAQFLIENDTNEAMAVELSVKERIMDENGKETLPEVKELTVFPPQMVIPPKDKRTIRVSWSGGNSLSSEKAFRVIAEQLPLKVDQKTKNRSGIQMLMRYMAALYVTPANATSEISTKIESSTKDGFVVLVENKGTAHQIMQNPILTIEGAKKKWSFKASELANFAGENVLAGSKRLFKVFSKDLIPMDGKVVLKLND